MYYRLYGVVIKSDLKLDAPTINSAPPHIVIKKAPPVFFLTLSAESPDKVSGIYYSNTRDNGFYIRFFDYFRFYIRPNGREILYERIHALSANKQDSSAVSPIVFLQTNVLSFSLIKLGFEVLHASAVSYKNYCAAFLGESGYGKSTILGALLNDNLSHLTDDVLAIKSSNNSFVARPGTGYLKLWPQTARKLIKGPKPRGKMSPVSNKWLLPVRPLEASESSKKRNYKISVLYILWPRFWDKAGKIWFRSLKPKDAVISIVKASHNLVINDSKRLGSQIKFLSRLVQKVPVRAICYPMNFQKMPELKRRIQRDLAVRLNLKPDFFFQEERSKRRQRRS